MAKISAGGATKVAEWRKGESRLVLTSDGRVLRKILKGDGYTVAAKARAADPATRLAQVDRFATARGFERVGA